ncbi:PLP-dependent aminotransferase family protein [Bacillus sp. FSL K6-0994]|uniref:MocR-like pyridoxine biosynthesis transcription factor PdxR n=1 Tax=Bacillus sp. FSL K6-0994 TaxID=2921457 RepID=UPI00315A2E06
MHIDIHRHSDTSLSNQIYFSIIDHIQSGLLQQGEKLPTVRDLAKQLNVSLVTAAKAYTRLKDDGYLTTVQGKGTFVDEQQEQAETPVPSSTSFDWQLSIPDYLPRSQFAQYHYVEEAINLSSSMIDPGLLPNRYLEKEMQHVLARHPQIMSKYGEIQGDLQLRQVIQSFLEKLDVPSTPENILVTSGSQQGLDLVARTFIGPDDVVVMEAPTYPGAIDVFMGRGARIITVPVDHEGMNMKQLQSICDKYKPKLIYTIPTFHSPTGASMSMKRRKQLLLLAQSIDCLIVEDDPYRELYFEKKPPAPIKSLDHDGHVIYLRGLSKTLAPGCRIGIITASGSIFNRLLAAKANNDLGSPLLTQKAILPFLTSKKMIDHTKKLRTALKVRRDLMMDVLTKHAPKDVTWQIPQGGLNLWLSFPSWVDTRALLHEARKQQITFLPGSVCYPGEPKQNYIRLSFSYVNEKALAEGVEKLCGIFQQALSTPQNQKQSLFF